MKKSIDQENLEIMNHFSALAFKIMTDPYVGKLTFFRVYSGQISTGDFIFNPNSGKKKELVD